MTTQEALLQHDNDATGEGCGGVDGFASALLREVGQLLQKFLQTGTPGSIDLLAMPVPPAEFRHLRNRLGRGELSIVLKASGHSQIWETAYSGVWWIEHRDEAAKLVARVIEVTNIPAIVPADRAEMMASAAKLIGSPVGVLA